MSDPIWTYIETPSGIGEAFGTISPKVSVGYYDLGSVQIHVSKMPSRFQQFMVRWCFGWIWHDAS